MQKLTRLDMDPALLVNPRTKIRYDWQETEDQLSSTVFVWPGEQKLFETSDVAMVEQAKEVAQEAQTARISALLGWGRESLQRALEHGSKSLFVSKTGFRHSEFIAANL